LAGIKNAKPGVEAIMDIEEFIILWDRAGTPGFFIK